MSRLYPEARKRGKAPNGRCFDCEQCMISDRKRKLMSQNRAGVWVEEEKRDSFCLFYKKNITEEELMVMRYCPRFEP